MRINKTSRIIVMILSLMMLMSVAVFAVEISIPNDNQGSFMDAMVKTGNEFATNGITYNENSTDVKVDVLLKNQNSGNLNSTVLIKYDKSNGTLIFDEAVFKNSNQKDAKNKITSFINNLKDSSVDLDTQQSIMSQIQESDSDVAAVMIPLIFDESKADLYTAYKWLYPFLSILRVVFGIGAIAIILLLVGSTIMDLVYIGLPVWREKDAENGKGKNPFGVSYEAIKTVKEIELTMTEGNYQNAYLLYFKRRALTYIVLAICLLYLIVGELGGLISWILSLASGIVG